MQVADEELLISFNPSCCPHCQGAARIIIVGIIDDIWVAAMVEERKQRIDGDEMAAIDVAFSRIVSDPGQDGHDDPGVVRLVGEDVHSKSREHVDGSDDIGGK